MNRLTKLKEKSNKWLAKYFTRAVIIVLMIMVVLNFGYLTENPFQRKLDFSAMEFCAINHNGYVALLDFSGKRIVILNEDMTVKSIIKPDTISSVGINHVQELIMDDDYLYIADGVLDSYGTSYESERILAYTLDGKYSHTVYTLNHNNLTEEYSLYTMGIKDNVLYPVLRIGNTVVVSKVNDGSLETVKRISFDERIFSVYYNPVTDELFCVTQNGMEYIHKNGVTATLAHNSNNTIYGDRKITANGNTYYTDLVNQKIVEFDSDNVKREAYSSFSIWMDSNEDNLVFVDLNNDSLNTLDANTGEVLTYYGANYSLKYFVIRLLIWLCLFVVLFVLLKYVVIKLYKYLKDKISNRNVEIIEKKSTGISIWDLYIRNGCIFAVAFIALSLTISVTYYASEKQVAVNAAYTMASSLSKVSDRALGDNLEEIKVVDDYSSSEYSYISNLMEDMCKSEVGSGFTMSYSIYKYEDDNILHVLSQEDGLYVGQDVTASFPEIKEELKLHDTYVYEDDDKYHVTSPVYNSKNKKVGFFDIAYNDKIVSSNTKTRVISLSVDLITLYIVFTLMAGEIYLTYEFLNIRKRFIKKGLFNKTICEGNRTCKFLAYVCASLELAFLPVWASELSLNGSAIYSALPLTVVSIVTAGVQLVAGRFTKRNPGKYIAIGSYLGIIFFVIHFIANIFNSYWLLIVGMVFSGIGLGLRFSGLGAQRASGLKPEKKFEDLVFCNIEPVVGGAVGTALGSFLYGQFGYIAIFIAGVIASVFGVLASKLFIHSDINISESVEKVALATDKRQLKADFDSNESTEGIVMKSATTMEKIKLVLRPDLLCLELCLMMPMCLVCLTEEYVLPMYNAKLGYSVVLTGFLSTVAKIVALSLTPVVFGNLYGRNYRKPLYISAIFVALGFALFGLNSSIFILAIVIVVVDLFKPIVDTFGERIQISECNKAGIHNSDVVGIFIAMEYTAETIGSIIMSGLIALGFNYLGFIMAILLIALMFGYVLVYGSYKGYVKRKAKIAKLKT